eukprot:TRINITY_DN16957_c1_g6_i1.p1 TRINITY_DN16957_c1_g6~~TRINITY_DN16957_c1_g6_i1.p1  ORF type:complete len:334 (+),score=48.35 TRINITY_DN16957_c1_g6_i1:98-1099(+)
MPQPVQTLDTKSPEGFNASAPGAPWGGQQTIWDAYRDLLLSEGGRFVQRDRVKPFWRRPSAPSAVAPEVASHPQSPGAASSSARSPKSQRAAAGWSGKPPERSVTMRKMAQWPQPTYDSSGFAAQQESWRHPQHEIARPNARTRLQTDGEATKTMLPVRPCNVVLPPSEQPLEYGGMRRLEWKRNESNVGGSGPDVVDAPVFAIGASRANSGSPRYAPLRYGAAVVRQQRAVVAAARSSEEGSLQGSGSRSPGSHAAPQRPRTAEKSHQSAGRHQRNRELSSGQNRPYTAQGGTARVLQRTPAGHGEDRDHDVEVSNKDPQRVPPGQVPLVPD